MTKSTAKPKVRARRAWQYIACPKCDQRPSIVEHRHICTRCIHDRKWHVPKFQPLAVLPADPASIEAMELQIATALQKNDDVWKNAPVEGYLPDARAALAAIGIK